MTQGTAWSEFRQFLVFRLAEKRQSNLEAISESLSGQRCCQYRGAGGERIVVNSSRCIRLFSGFRATIFGFAAVEVQKVLPDRRAFH